MENGGCGASHQIEFNNKCVWSRVYVTLAIRFTTKFIVPGAYLSYACASSATLCYSVLCYAALNAWIKIIIIKSKHFPSFNMPEYFCIEVTCVWSRCASSIGQINTFAEWDKWIWNSSKQLVGNECQPLYCWGQLHWTFGQEFCLCVRVVRSHAVG